MTQKQILVRKDEFGGDCAICGTMVLLDTSGEPWTMSCGCGTYNIPMWAIVDPYSRKQYRRRYELKVVEIPDGAVNKA